MCHMVNSYCFYWYCVINTIKINNSYGIIYHVLNVIQNLKCNTFGNKNCINCSHTLISAFIFLQILAYLCVCIIHIDTTLKLNGIIVTVRYIYRKNRISCKFPVSPGPFIIHEIIFLSVVFVYIIINYC